VAAGRPGEPQGGRQGGQLGLCGWAEGRRKKSGRREKTRKEGCESKKGEADMWVHRWVVDMEYEI
jgi:hypothetical protein